MSIYVSGLCANSSAVLSAMNSYRHTLRFSLVPGENIPNLEANKPLTRPQPSLSFIPTHNSGTQCWRTCLKNECYRQRKKWTKVKMERKTVITKQRKNACSAHGECSSRNFTCAVTWIALFKMHIFIVCKRIKASRGTGMCSILPLRPWLHGKRDWELVLSFKSVQTDHARHYNTLYPRMYEYFDYFLICIRLCHMLGR